MLSSMASPGLGQYRAEENRASESDLHSDAASGPWAAATLHACHPASMAGQTRPMARPRLARRLVSTSGDTYSSAIPPEGVTPPGVSSVLQVLILHKPPPPQLTAQSFTSLKAASGTPSWSQVTSAGATSMAYTYAHVHADAQTKHINISCGQERGQAGGGM